jgi:tetratricopeptide (TPR) repeat protein
MRYSLLCSFIVLWSSLAHSNTPQNMTPGEIARLPAYCVDTQGMSPNSGTPSAPTPAQQRWVAIMGEPFWALHHYCWALLNANRAAQPSLTAQQREFLFRWAISDCIYVLNNSTREFVLLPEIYLRMGQFAINANSPAEAIEHFEKSRQIKPDYWPPYIEMSKLQVSLRRPQEAVNILKAGLEIMPNETRLSDALAALTAAKPEPAATKRPERSARVAPK